MSNTPNELADMFPNKRDLIHELKVSDPDFAQLTEDYHRVTRAVHRGETNIEPMDDIRMENLRKDRLRLLDTIAGHLA